MKSKLIWLGLSWLVVLSLVLVSCAPAPTEEEKAVTEEEVVTKEEVTPIPKAEMEEKPQYGGRATVILHRDVQGFDRTLQRTPTWHIAHTLVYEELLTADLTMGPLGTNKADFTIPYYAPLGFVQETGHIAESWETPDNQTLVFKIRRGIHWHNKPPVNGRELNASDVAFSLKREYGFYPGLLQTYNTINAPFGLKVTDIYVDPDDPWKVVVKVEDFAPAWIEDITEKNWIVPPESIKKYGNLLDWRNSLGTGPFMLTDYVPGSSLTFARNPNWWFKNPAGPGKGDQLPYLDEVKALVIPDKSTQLSAMRTGKIDTIAGGTSVTSGGAHLDWEDIESLLKTNPEIKYKQVGTGRRAAFGIRTTSTDPLAAPLMNQRVRWAMSMAIDREAMWRDLYKGKAEDPRVPEFQFPKASPYWTSLDDMVEILQRVHGVKPEEAQMVKKQFEYNPEEAKRILAEEGYPNGFKTSVVTTQAFVDINSVLAGYLAKVGIKLEIDVKEAGVESNIKATHTFPAMLGTTGGGLSPGRPERWLFELPGKKDAPFAITNWKELYHPVLEKGILGTFENFGDIPKRSEIIRDTTPYLVWLAWEIMTPDAYQYNAWQPWLKLYTGESAFGLFNTFNWLGWSWYDQNLKKEITGK